MTSTQTDASTRYPRPHRATARCRHPRLRDFDATRPSCSARTRPVLYAQWIGPDGVGADVTHGTPRRRRLELHRARQRRPRGVQTSFAGASHRARGPIVQRSHGRG